MSYPEYKYTLIATHGYYNSKLTPLSQLPKVYKGEAYAHIMRYPESIKKHFNKGGKVRDYYSTRYSQHFPIDIDFIKDLNQAKDMIVQFMEWLSLEHEVDPRAIEIYFSGLKGFHILIPSKLFQITPNGSLESKFKQLATLLFQGHPIQDSDAIDFKIYSRNRLLRLPNSVHPTSSLYKIPLTWKELNSLSILEIKRLAQSPRSLNSLIPLF